MYASKAHKSNLHEPLAELLSNTVDFRNKLGSGPRLFGGVMCFGFRLSLVLVLGLGFQVHLRLRFGFGLGPVPDLILMLWGVKVIFIGCKNNIYFSNLKG